MGLRNLDKRKWNARRVTRKVVNELSGDLELVTVIRRHGILETVFTTSKMYA